MTERTGMIYHRGECNYGELDAVNISTLKALRRSPKHYRHWLTNPKAPTTAMQLGTAAHIAVLEPERFLREFALWDEQTDTGRTRPRRGKAWDEFCEANVGKTIIRRDEYDAAIAMKDAIRADPVAMRYLAVGRPEVTLAWVDAHTGTKCKGRVDWLGTDDGWPCIVGLKSAADAAPHAFGRQCAKLDYHLQTAFYADGYEAATGKAPRVVEIVVESTPPHDVVTFILGADVLEIGRDQYRQLLESRAACMAAGEWPGQGNGREVYLQLPRWAVPDDDDTADLGLTGWKEVG